MPSLSNLEALAAQEAKDRAGGGAASAGSVSSLEWRSKVQPLPALRPEAPDLPGELLPIPLRSWLADIAERMQVPLAFPAVPALVALAAVVGRRIAVRPKAEDDWVVVPNLWGGIVAPPGALKSPVLAEGLKPIRRLVAQARDDFERLLVEKGSALESLKAKEAALKSLLRQAWEGKKDKGSPAEHEESLKEVRQQIQELERDLVQRRYVVNDATVEKLGELLAANPLGLLLERDELAGWLRSLERDDRKGDREFFLETWNGLNPYTYDRIGRGTLHVPAMCLSIVGGIQPAKLARYTAEALEGGFAADGLLQRFQLLVWPEVGGEWQLVDRAPDREAREAAFRVFAALDRGEVDLPTSEDGGVPTLSFSAEAQGLFYDWLTRLEVRLRSPDLQAWPAFASHLAKYRSLMPTLALLLHLVEVASGGGRGPVSLDAAKLAADWCEYLELHARKVYAAEIDADRVAAQALAAKIRKGAIYDGMTVRDVYRSGWTHLKTSDAVSAGLRVLEDLGWLRVVVVEGKGRPSPVIRLNPALKEGHP